MRSSIGGKCNNNMLSKEIHIPIYEQTMKVIYANSDEYKALIKRAYNYEAAVDGFWKGAVLELTSKSKGMRVLILWINKGHFYGEKLETLMDTLFHEVTHAVDYVMDHAGILNDTDNNEPRCYLSGYIGSEAYKAIKKLREQ